MRHNGLLLCLVGQVVTELNKYTLANAIKQGLNK